MLKGSIVLIPFPFTDLSGQNVRPALVLSELKSSEDCIVAFISSLKQKRIHEYDLAIDPSQTNGLKIASVIKMEKIATLQKKSILGPVGKLEPSILRAVDEKLKKLFKL